MKRSRSDRSLIPMLLLMTTVLPLYLAFRSVSPDDFDSYSFILALERFSLTLQQPQPPGFPVYVFVGRLAALFTDRLPALTLLSALSGAALAVCIYQLGSAAHGSDAAGVGAALLVALTPMGWLTAEKALSDAPGLALTLLSIWALWRGRDDVRRLTLGCLIAGLSFGLRPQNGLPVALLLAGLLVRHARTGGPARSLAGPMAAFAAGVLVWLAPTVIAIGGPAEYWSHIAGHSVHVRQADSLLAGGEMSWTVLRGRGVAFAHTLLLHTLGVGMHARWGWSETTRVVLAAAVVAPGLARAGWRRRETLLLASWAGLVAAQILLLQTLDRPRLMLPLLPPLALLTAQGWAQIGRRRAGTAVMGGAAFLLLLQTVPLAAQLASIPAPPVQATDYVAERYPPAETLVAVAGSFRAAQVELPGYRLAYLYQFDPDAARPTDVRYVVVFDRDQFPADAMAVLSDDGQYVSLEEHTFGRDPRVHTQHDQVRLQVLTRADLLPVEALALPTDGCIDLGGTDDGRYVGQGWYRPEEISGVVGRWAGETVTSTLRVYLPAGQAYHLALRALAYPDSQALTVQVNGYSVGHFPLATGWSEHRAALQAEFILPGQVTVIELVHDRLADPFSVTGGSSSDRRPLAAAYDWICLQP